jgi:hypothetical protein
MTLIAKVIRGHPSQSRRITRTIAAVRTARTRRRCVGADLLGR